MGCSGYTYIKTFKYFENFENNAKANNKFLGWLRYIEYDGNLNNLAEFFDPPLDSVFQEDRKRKIKLSALSIANEKKMLQKLKQIAECCLKKYPQTLEEDIKLLKENKDMTFNKRNSIIYRCGEKKVNKLI